MKRVAITGAKGVIGTVLMGRLTNYERVAMDLPEYDLTEMRPWHRMLEGFDAVIHLAWTPDETYTSGTANPANITMATQVLAAARRAKVGRVLVASSIHVNGVGPNERRLQRVTDPVRPRSPYGLSKAKIEQMCRTAATRETPVIAIRFGGVNAENKRPGDPLKERRWLSHEDLVLSVERCLEAPIVRPYFAVVWGISQNSANYHDIDHSTREPLGRNHATRTPRL